MGSFLKNIHPLLRREKKNDYSDVNYAVLKALEGMLDEAEQSTIDAKAQSSLKTASGDMLSEWGLWFGVYRATEETDLAYRNRVIQYVNMPRGTNSSIKLAIRNYLNDPYVGVEIFEPWNSIFYLNRSKLNGTDKLMGGYYRFAVINVSVGSPFDDDLIDYINKFKPAGVELHVTYDPSLPRINSNYDESMITKLLNMMPYRSESVVTRLTGLDQQLGGRIQLTDTDQTVDAFETNVTSLGTTNVLTGSFTQLREHYHLASLGRSIKPTLATTLGNVLASSEELLDSFYDATGNIDTDNEVVRLDSATQLYMTLNIDKYLTEKYYGSSVIIPRTKEAYADVLGDPQITMVLSATTSGKTARLQAYNFVLARWETIQTQLVGANLEKTSSTLTHVSNYLNESNLIFTRLAVGNTVDLKVDYVALDYRTAYSGEPYIFPVDSQII